ncbi:MAG: hypothetical protein LBI54_01775 [Lachnospiraceae bacterium]|jgi:hypothetical protein|nr:hypothetical protein [Lachnospiraceae bacterium]
MVTVISEDNRIKMSRESIKSAYDGKWVFLINVNLEPQYSAVPVVIADKPYEGREKGIYKPFQDGEGYGLTGYVSLLRTCSMEGFEAF